MKLEQREFALESKRSEIRAVREEGKPSKLAGYAAPFNSESEDLGGFREVIAPGAFAETLKGDDIRGLVNHETRLVIGRTTARTLKLWEDDRGLAFEIDLPNTSYANDLVESIERKDVTGMSFRFYLESFQDERWGKFNGMWMRTLIKVRLVEVSPVTFPAYPGSAVASRSMGDGAPEGLARAIAQDAAAAEERARRIRLAEIA